jgi:RNA polymerase sigma-70 factor, ECF subfamily
MSGEIPGALQSHIDAIYRQESRRIRATLVRLLRSFELAEEAVQDAFIAAAEQWPRDGTPEKPHTNLPGKFSSGDSNQKADETD